MTAEIVEAHLTGSLARYGPAAGEGDPARAIPVAPGRSVIAVAAELGIPAGQPFVAVVNGRTSDLTYVLAPGDRLTLIPPIAGG